MKLTANGSTEPVADISIEAEDGEINVYLTPADKDAILLGSFGPNSKGNKVLFTRYSNTPKEFVAVNKRGRILTVGE